jgi:uncharacterized membrane protein
VETGQSLVLSATALDAASRPVAGARVRWTSRSPAVAEVRDGVVTGRAPGRAVVVASAGAAADSLLVTVESSAEVGIRLWPDTLYLLPGHTMRVGAEVRDASGKPVSQRLHYATSAPGVATVTEDGEVRAGAYGQAWVTVSAGLRSASVPVRVVTGDRYALAELPAPPGWRVFATRLNNRGEAVGYLFSQTSANRALLWRGGAMVDLGVPAGFSGSLAYGISDAGVVVGSAHGPNSFTSSAPWIWSGDGYRVLDVGAQRASASDVNTRGEVVGQRQGGAGPSAFVHRDGQVSTIVPADALSVLAVAVNESGAAVVSFYHSTRSWSSAVWRDGRLTEVPIAEATTPVAINERGDVVGRFQGPSLDRSGWLWDGQKVTVIPGRAPLTDFNDHGEIVAGATGHPAGGNLLLRGGVWRPLQQMIPAGWELTDVRAINNGGWILAHGRHVATGREANLLLTPRD